MTEVLAEIKDDAARFRIYGTNHSDEDGSWQMLTILDTREEEIFLIKVGFSAT